MKYKYQQAILVAIMIGLAVLGFSYTKPSAVKPTATKVAQVATATPKKTKTPTAVVTITPSMTTTLLPTFTRTATETVVPTESETPGATNTPIDTFTPAPTFTLVPTVVVIQTSTPGAVIQPYPSAPPCPDIGAGHDYTKFHTLWDSVRGCHYDHEHGENAFTTEVANAFPGFDLFTLQCFVQVGSCNPSSPIENLTKHGGMKTQVQVQTAHGCNNITPTGPFEGATYGVDAAVIQYHAFGDPAIEFEARVHSAQILVRVCNNADLSDKGYMYVAQFEDYGQRVIPYQGLVVPYPNNPIPAYDSPRGPYFTDDCVGAVPQCRVSLQFVLDRNVNVNSIWTSKPTGQGERPDGSTIFSLLFRIRDVYSLFDWADQVYPFTFKWVCSSDGGLTYNGTIPGCRWNNSTTRVHEVAGEVFAIWDNLAGFDTDPRTGRVTAEGFVTRYGDLNLDCTVPDVAADCFPIKMVQMFVGKYGDEITAAKVSNSDAISNPERDICFNGSGQVASCDAPGAIPSGWIGANN